MTRVFRSLLAIAGAIALAGLAVSDARADGITFNGGCLAAPCSAGTLTVSGTSLSFGNSMFSLDMTASDLVRLGFEPELLTLADLSVAATHPQAVNAGGAAPLNVTRKRVVPTDTIGDIWWWVGGSNPALNATQSTAALTLRLGSSGIGSFSVTGTNLVNAPSSSSSKSGDTSFQANGAEPNLVGAPTPELTTMLLFGTGLVGAATVLRKKLKVRRPELK